MQDTIRLAAIAAIAKVNVMLAGFSKLGRALNHNSLLKQLPLINHWRGRQHRSTRTRQGLQKLAARGGLLTIQAQASNLHVTNLGLFSISLHKSSASSFVTGTKHLLRDKIVETNFQAP